MPTTLNLSNPDDRKTLSQQIRDDIEEYCETLYATGHRKHLGASLMGEPCARKLFYTFRWVKAEKFAGRILRLFNVGNEAEPRFVKYLKGIGFEVNEVDPTTGRQFRILSCNGHYGGSLDGKAKAPAKYNINEDLLLEFKTNNTGKGYTAVDEDGLAKAKPKHWAQMAQYGFHHKLKYGLYLIENKNDSDITVQIVELDWNLGMMLENKAKDIIGARLPPPKISENPSYYECKLCNFKNVCHDNELPDKNCRSCKFSIAVENSQWKCTRFNDMIPVNFIPSGCDNYNAI